MSQWNIKASTLFILSCLVFLMLLIVVLPDVDLPDAAFHRGTAPVVVHARATTALVAVLLAVPLPKPTSIPSPFQALVMPGVHADPNFRPILLRSIRC